MTKNITTYNILVFKIVKNLHKSTSFYNLKSYDFCFFVVVWNFKYKMSINFIM